MSIGFLLVNILKELTRKCITAFSRIPLNYNRCVMLSFSYQNYTCATDLHVKYNDSSAVTYCMREQVVYEIVSWICTADIINGVIANQFHPFWVQLRFENSNVNRHRGPAFIINDSYPNYKHVPLMHRQVDMLADVIENCAFHCACWSIGTGQIFRILHGSYRRHVFSLFKFETIPFISSKNIT